MPKITDIKTYREKYPYLTSPYKTDEDLVKAHYSQHEEELKEEFKTLEDYKKSLGVISLPDDRKQKPVITDDEVEQEIVAHNPNAVKRKQREKQILENAQRTIGKPVVTVLQNVIDMVNNATMAGDPSLSVPWADVSPFSGKTFEGSWKKRQQQALISTAEKIVGKETIEIVNRSGIPSLEIKDPTYKGGREVVMMGTLLANAVGWQKTLVKHGPKAVTKMQKWLQGTTSGLLAEQTGWDIYEDRLLNMLGEHIGDDRSAYNNIVRYLEADRDDPQLEARMGVLVEGALLAGGLNLVWQGGKTSLKPAKEAVVKKLRELRAVKNAKKQTQYRRSLNEGTVYGRAAKEKAEKAKVKYKTRPEESYSKTSKEALIEEDDITSNLWQFSGEFGEGALGDTIKRQVYHYLGGGLFKSRGQFTPKLFDMFNAGENAKRAWVTRGEHIVRNLENGIYKLAKGIGDEVDIATGQKLTSKKQEYIDDLLQKIQSYFSGDTVKLKGMAKTRTITREEIPKSLRPILDEARALQDDLSELYTKSDYVPKEVKKIISSNIGKYLKKMYNFYEAGILPSEETVQGAIRYFEGVTRRAITKVGNKRFLKTRLPDSAGKMRQRKIPISKDGTVIIDEKVWKLKDWIRQDAKGTVSEIIGARKTATDVFNYVDLVYGRLPGMLKARKNLPKAVKALLGETKDPRATILNSISKIANSVETDNFLSQAWQLGKGKYFHSRGTGIYSEQILNRNMGALYKKYTTPEMANIFKQQGILYGKGTGNKLYTYFLAGKGYGQASKTVLNHITHLRNTLGGATFMLANGMNPLSKESRKAFKILQNEIDTLGKRRKGTLDFERQYDELYEKYQKLGLINTSAKAGDFRALIDDAADLGIEQTIGGKFIKKLTKIPQKLYIAEDDLFKVSSFLKEVDTLTKAYGKGYSKEALEREAAAIVRNTIPNYDLVPQGIKQLRKLPFGNFFSFPAEMVRTSFHIVRQSGIEMASTNGVIRQRGYKRAAGFMGAGMLGAEGLSQATQLAMGVTDRTVDAIRHLLEPEYSKYTNQVYMRDLEGNLYKNNFSYVDPYDVLKRPLRTLLMDFSDGKRTQEERDKMLMNAMLTATLEFVKPFTEEALLTESLIDVLFREGETKEGQKIKGWDYSEGVEANKFIKNLGVGIKHILETFIPGSAPQFKRLYKSFSDDPVLPSGQELNKATEIIANFTGIRWQKINEQYVEDSLRRKIWQYGKEEKNARNNMNQAIGAGRNEKDVIKKFLQSQKDHYNNWKNLKFAQDSAKVLYEEVLGHSNNIMKTDSVMKKYGIKSGVLSKKTLKMLNYNRYPPFELSDNQKQQIREENTFDYTDDIGLFSILNKYTGMFYSLPMLDLEHEEYRNNILEALDKRAYKILKEEGYKRNKKFTGGEVSEDYPVPNVIKDPSERKNPSTGQPYDEPLERLGFRGGGLMNGIQDPLSRLGFTGGGGLMVSIGVAPVSEKQMSKFEKALKKRKAKRDGGRIGFAEGEEVDNSLRLDEHKKSAVGWLGPIRNNITGKTMTELSIGGGKEGEPFYPLMNPLLNEKEIEHLQDNDYEGKAYKLQETEIGRQMLEKAQKFYLMRKREGLSPFYKDEVGPFQYGDRQSDKNGGSIKNKLQYRKAKRDGGSADIEEIVVKALKRIPQKGKEAYEYAIDKMGENNLDKQFLKEIAYVESKYAEDKGSFRKGNRSAYQITPLAFQEFKETINPNSSRGRGLRAYANKIKDRYDVDISKVTYDELNDPLIGTAVTRALWKLDPEPIGNTVKERANQWKRYWNTEEGKGTVDRYLDDVTFMNK